MLRSFRLENHRSFRDETELSLLPAYGGGAARPVSVAAVYGANAAGKSNLLDGLSFMRHAVRDSYRRWDPSSGVPRHPFRLDPSSRSEPSSFVIELELRNVRFTYGFVVDDAAVLEEWLYSYPKGKRRRLFEREGMSVEFGESIGAGRAKAEVLAELTRPSALFLSLAAQVSLPELLPVYDWFVAGGISSSRSSRRLERETNQRLLAYLQDHPDRLAAVLSFVRSADVGIQDVVIEHAQPSLLREPTGQRIDLVKPEPPRVKFRHGHQEWFELRDESDGTVAWLSILPGALTALETGGLLVVDEIDSSLHPNLTALLIKQFRSPEANKRGAQLLFTTHDATLLGTSFGEEILGRDQVWFVEKAVDGASKLYPLTDFKPRAGGENRERRYLGGSYGAVPVVPVVVPLPNVQEG